MFLSFPLCVPERELLLLSKEGDRIYQRQNPDIDLFITFWDYNVSVIPWDNLSRQGARPCRGNLLTGVPWILCGLPRNINVTYVKIEY